MSRLSADDVGARVSVRRRDAEGALRDVVGDLESLDDEKLAIRRSGGELVAVTSADVVAARVVAPSPRAAIELEAVSGRGWPAVENEWLGQWWLRAADGFTLRANFLRPLGSPGLAFDEALTRSVAWYASRALPPRARVVAGSSHDREFERRGWTPDSETAVFTATIARVTNRLRQRDFPGGAVPAAAVALTSEPTSGWLALFRVGELPAVARAVLGGVEPVAFASVTDAVGPVAIGRASVEKPWVGLNAIEVRPDARRRGYARAVVASLVSWATGEGAARMYLEVTVGNTPAITLYESLGFTEHHHYVYRQPPRVHRQPPRP